ncbi:transposase [Mariniflexile gromovii]|uniref:IS110 family transposase n=1 Tax=Mariniflexile gromovii TaxID=362523 RepID=UPI00293D212A|nr:IS110 family transposase [Mariniflexile gromovii]
MPNFKSRFTWEFVAITNKTKRISTSIPNSPVSKGISIISVNQELNHQYRLITSIKGIGSQTVLFMTTSTNGFTKFKTWRKFAAYCGIAPFPNSSVTSIRGKTKVSNLANKKIKSLFNLCAKSAIQNNPEMKLYYCRRVENGKNKMSTINIIRCKLLARVFATVKRQPPYVDTFRFKT